VTHFIDTVFATYSTYYREGGHGRFRYFTLWSDNCGEQFKNKFHFGWGSAFLQKYKLNAIYFNFFAPGHGKGICEVKVATASMHVPRLPYTGLVFFLPGIFVCT
jgi:hypothetical protein